jgi:hypothetical protein
MKTAGKTPNKLPQPDKHQNPTGLYQTLDSRRRCRQYAAAHRLHHAFLIKLQQSAQERNPSCKLAKYGRIRHPLTPEKAAMALCPPYPGSGYR